MKNEVKALQLAGLKEISEEERYYQSSKCEIYDKCLEMAEWKDKQLWLLIDSIDHAYLQTDGTYGDLALEVVDKVEYLKNQLYSK